LSYVGLQNTYSECKVFTTGPSRSCASMPLRKGHTWHIFASRFRCLLQFR